MENRIFARAAFQGFSWGLLFLFLTTPTLALAHPMLAAYDERGGLALDDAVMSTDAPDASSTIADDNALRAPNTPPPSGTPLILLVRGAVDGARGQHGTPMSPAAVATNNDLAAYAKDKLLNDNAIDSIAVSSASVCMNYEIPAKLFGVVPVSVAVHASVSPTGAISVQYPWYDFALSTDKSTLEGELSDAAKAVLAQEEAQQQGFTPEMQALLLDDLHDVLSGSASSTTA